MPTASAQEILHAFVGDQSQWDTWFTDFGTIGDVNGDGVTDFIYGCPGPRMHRVRSGADWSTLARYRSTNYGGYHDTHGTSVSGIGLWDGDDVPDYAVGAPGASAGEVREGAVRIFSGATHTLIQEITEHNYYDRMGRGVFGLGDLDGDGYPELAVTGTAESYVRIYSAPDGAPYRTYPWFSGNEPPVAPYGDWDGDGGFDYLIGEHSYSQPLTTCGRVTLYSGKTGEELLHFVGQREREKVGLSVSVAGDWNGDGITDVATGAPGSWTGTGGEKCGVYVFSGADGSVLRFFDGEDYAHAESSFGHAVASGKDVNGDGFPDLLVGAPAEKGDGTERRGAVYLISGRTGAVLWEHHGPDEDDLYKLGEYVYLIDDHDSDGLAEWVVSDPNHESPLWAGRGRVAIYRGAVGDRGSGCDTTPNSIGPGARLLAAGPISLRNNLLRLAVEDAPPVAPALLVHGEPGGRVPFGAGSLCIDGAPHLVTSLVTGADGAAAIPIDFWQPPFSDGPGAVHVGDTVAFQLLYADAVAGGRNTSDSIVIRFVP